MKFWIKEMISSKKNSADIFPDQNINRIFIINHPEFLTMWTFHSQSGIFYFNETSRSYKLQVTSYQLQITSYE